MAKIQNQFGQSLPLNTLFLGATIEHLAIILHQKTISVPQSPLVEIQPVGSKRPFFCVHPAGGNVFCYVDLARHLGLEQPFYGLQALGLDSKQEPFLQIEKMASCYITALQTVQSEGPYLLGGWSMGGIVAFEMARQLQAQGQKVALLALMDTTATTSGTEPTDEDDLALWGSFAQECGLVLEELEFSIKQFLQLEPEERLVHVLEQAKMANSLPPNMEMLQFRSLFQVFQANVQAMLSYRPQHFTGRVTLFKASNSFVEVRSPG